MHEMHEIHEHLMFYSMQLITIHYVNRHYYTNVCVDANAAEMTEMDRWKHGTDSLTSTADAGGNRDREKMSHTESIPGHGIID